MGLFSAIGGFISAAISTIGPVITTVADVLINKLPPVIETAKLIIDTVSTVISKVCEVLEIAPLGDNTEELGAKVIQEGTREKLEDETTQEYLDYLRNDVSLDREKYEKMSAEEKLACEVLGTTMKAKCIEERMGVEIPAEFLISIEKSKLSHEQVGKYIEAFAQNGIASMGDFSRYISNDMSEQEAKKVGGAVKEAIKELNPELTEEDIQSEIVSMKSDFFSSNY